MGEQVRRDRIPTDSSINRLRVRPEPGKVTEIRDSSGGPGPVGAHGTETGPMSTPTRPLTKVVTNGTSCNGGTVAGRQNSGSSRAGVYPNKKPLPNLLGSLLEEVQKENTRTAANFDYRTLRDKEQETDKKLRRLRNQSEMSDSEYFGHVTFACLPESQLKSNT